MNPAATPGRGRHYLIPIYFTSGGVAGGLLMVGGLAGLLSLPRGVAVLQLRDRLAGPLILVSAGLLTASLAHPLRVFRLLLTFRPTSLVSWGTYILVASAATAALLMTGPTAPAHLWLNGLSVLLGALLAGYTGLILTTSARQRWAATPFLGGVFLVQGCATAVGLSVSYSVQDAAGSRLLLWITLALFSGTLLRSHLAELERDYRAGRLLGPLPARVPALLGIGTGALLVALLFLGPLAVHSGSLILRTALALVTLCGDLAFRFAMFWLEESPRD